MTDRELLERAAKAAGICIDDWNGDYPVVYIEHWSGNPDEQPEREASYWSPLTDDGDALRLAVQLGISVTQEQKNGWVYADVVEQPRDWPDEEYGSDPYAATRRAIVRAAAAMAEE